MGLDKAQGGPGALFHDVAQASGEYQLTLAVQEGHLHREEGSPHLGPGETVGQTRTDLIMDLVFPGVSVCPGSP